MRTPWLSAAVVILSMAAAFALRVVPAHQKVFTPYGVEFQETDAWFHMRTVHNQIAHFPRRSGFDPYAIYPGGQDIPTGPVWDWMIASSAWLAGLGAPSSELVDRVGAWLPAVLGALFPAVAFFLARSLAGELAGMFAAWSVALMPGAFLWLTHLGLADHHAAESFFALVTLTAICMAVAHAESGRLRSAAWLTLAGGASLGALLGTRPAGAFIIVIFILAALGGNRTFVAVTLGVLVVGALLFVPVGKLIWSDYAWLFLIAGIVVMIAVLALDVFWRRRKWPAAALTVSLATLALVAIVFGIHSRPALLASLWLNVQRITGAADYSGIAGTVRELRPVLAAGTSPFAALVSQLGLAWMVAIPALIWIAVRAVRTREPAWTLFGVWSLVMTVAGFAQLRMVVYYGPIAALLSALAAAAIVEALPTRLRLMAGLALATVILVANVPLALARVAEDAGPTRDWLQAMDWVRQNTPEPIGDASAYTRYYPRLGDGHQFTYPPSAYGIAIWWDFGYLLLERGRRIPSTNGTQSGARETARFYSETDPGQAIEALHSLGARYAVADPSLAVFDFGIGTSFDSIVQSSGRPLSAYYRVIYSDEDGQWRPTILYLPDYFRSMAVRMYLNDAKSVAASGAWVVSTQRQSLPGGTIVEALRWRRRFDSEKQAREFIDAPPGFGMPAQKLTLASFDTSESCVDLDAVDGLRMVFSSDVGPIRRGRRVRAVKVFEVAR